MRTRELYTVEQTKWANLVELEIQATKALVYTERLAWFKDKSGMFGAFELLYRLEAEGRL